ncbi:unnamed protein product, partial [Discosporangium mesarthrocarpum]
MIKLCNTWCKTEELGPVWLEVSRALQALEESRVGEKGAVWSLAETRSQVSSLQEAAVVSGNEVQALQQEVSRFRELEKEKNMAWESTSNELKSVRDDLGRRNRLLDSLWTRLSFLELLPPPPSSAAPPPSRSEGLPSPAPAPTASSGQGCVYGAGGGALGDPGACGRVAVDVSFVEKEGQISAGLDRLVEEWTARGSQVERLTERLQSESEGRVADRLRLEDMASAKGEELARAVLEFEGRLEEERRGAERRVAEVQAAALEERSRELDETKEALASSEDKGREAQEGLARQGACLRSVAAALALLARHLQ